MIPKTKSNSTRHQRREEQRKALNRYSSSAYHLDATKPGTYSIAKARQFFYRDRVPGRRVQNIDDAAILVENCMPPKMVRDPHLVLRDSRGTPRFSLRYWRGRNGGVTIGDIQMTRQEYKPGRENMYIWDSVAEGKKAGELRAALGGVRPSEFLIAEFVRRNRTQILRSLRAHKTTGVRFDRSLLGIHSTKYQPLLKAFFRQSEDREYTLNENKARVRSLLGLK